MPKSDAAKTFQELVDDFCTISERAIINVNKEALSDEKQREKEQRKATEEPEARMKREIDKYEAIDSADVFDADFDRLYTRTFKDCVKYDRAFEKLTESRKAATSKKDGKSSGDEPGLVSELEYTSDRVGKSLDGFSLRIRADFIGAKDEHGQELGEKLKRAANILFTGVKKLDAEIDKAAATELKRKPREEKKIEIVPTKFLAEYKKATGKLGKEGRDGKLEKSLGDVEERLKRLDGNTVFDKVTELCDLAKLALKNAIKLSGDDKPLNKILTEILAGVKKHDSHMFLLGRSR